MRGSAISKSYGKSDYDLPGVGNYTECDALTSTRGSTAPIVGVSQTYYEQKSPFVLVAGPRVSKFIRYLDELNRAK